MIVIEKNIPVPISGKIIGTTLSLMQVGDSFFLADETPTIRITIYQQARKLKAEDKKQFTSKSQDGGVRVWRLL